MTTTDYELYAKNVLGIPYVNFENIDQDTIKVILKVLKEAFTRYPLLAKSLITIGNKEDINNQLLLTYCSNKTCWRDWQKKNRNYDYIGNISKSTFVTSCLEQWGECYYIGLCLCPILKQLGYLDFEKYKNENPNGHVPIKDSFLKPAVWHEVGHMLDFIMHLSDSLAFQRIVKNHDIKNEISLYATIDKSELLAEAFSIYILEKDNSLANQIGLLIDKEYLRYSKNILLKEKFNIRRYYKR